MVKINALISLSLISPNSTYNSAISNQYPLISTGASRAGRGGSATSASATPAACTAPARSRTSATATRAGEDYSATRTSTTALTTGKLN